MKQLKVVAGTTDAFGTRPTDNIISLGRADVFNLVAVFDSESATTDALAPEFTLTNQSGTFTRGEKITGGTSTATARIVDITSPISYVLSTSIAFVSAETITGESSGATATIGTLTDGSIDIAPKYDFDDGLRDNFYDISRILRKKDFSGPTGRLLIVYDYFEHGVGDVFTVDSYVDIAGQMSYDDIPVGSSDAFDFRSRVEDIAGTSTTLEIIDEITGNSFDFFSRQYDGTGASIADVCKPGSLIQADFEYFLSRRSSVVIDVGGRISVIEGTSAEVPQLPDIPDDSMKLADLFIPAYTLTPSSVVIDRTRNQRFTMKDIGRIDKRLGNVERMTTLSLLESSAADFEVLDANGLNRFKSGFVVDNFQGHKVGAAFHVDYRNSMDFLEGTLRAVHVTKSVDLEENITTDSARTSAGYQKTGDLITLPYTEVVMTEQPYASTVERVAPFLTATWKGAVSLDPSQDNWFETEIAPELIINRQGNYDAVLASVGNNLGAVWNAWRNAWGGMAGQPIGTGAGENVEDGNDF